MTTLRDVAARAGVSAMTVSNVVNGRQGKVSASTLKRVQEAIDELGYVPNAQARSLALGGSRALALVYQAVPSRAALSAPYESVFAGACERAARAAGYVLMLCGTSDPDELVTQLRAWNVAGAIVMATTQMAPDEFAARTHVPSVFIDAYAGREPVSFVDIDDHLGGWLVGERMASLGHRSVSFLGPAPSGSSVVRQRWDGFREGFAHGGGDPTRARYGLCEVGFDDGVAAGLRLAMERHDAPRHDDAPTAVFASGDVLAVGVVAGLRRGGVSVPEEVSVVGFDGLEMSTYSERPLTTVSQPIERKAEEAVAILVRQLGGQTDPQHVVLPVSWREGETLTAPGRPPAA